jgi:hypothetical protein
VYKNPSDILVVKHIKYAYEFVQNQQLYYVAFIFHEHSLFSHSFRSLIFFNEHFVIFNVNSIHIVLNFTLVLEMLWDFLCNKSCCYCEYFFCLLMYAFRAINFYSASLLLCSINFDMLYCVFSVASLYLHIKI